MSLDALLKVATPPAKPLQPVAPTDWASLESKLGFRFPADYKTIIEKYGPGHFASFFGLRHPFYESELEGTYDEWWKMRLQMIEDAKASYPEHAVSAPTYPQPGGLFPWGYTDHGDTLLWLMEAEDPSRWPIIFVDDGCSNADERFDVSVAQFLADWLSGETDHSFSPEEFFPLEKPVFRSF